MIVKVRLEFELDSDDCAPLQKMNNLDCCEAHTQSSTKKLCCPHKQNKLYLADSMNPPESMFCIVWQCSGTAVLGSNALAAALACIASMTACRNLTRCLVRAPNPPKDSGD